MIYLIVYAACGRRSGNILRDWLEICIMAQAMKRHPTRRLGYGATIALMLALTTVIVVMAAAVETNVSNTTNAAFAPAIVVLPGGVVQMVWEEDDGAIHASTYANGSWGASQSISFGDSPALAGDSSGAVYLAWVDLLGSNFEILYSSRPSGGTWSVPINVSLTNGASAAPAIATDGSGNPHIVWIDTSSGTPTIYYSDLSVGGPIPSGSGTAPDIAVDSSGARHVVWQDNGQPSVIAYTRNDGTGWSLPQQISDNTTSDARAPKIAVCNGMVYVVWAEGGRIRAAEGSGGNWTTPATISGTDTGAQPPTLQCDGLGNLHAAWINNQQALRYTHRRPAGAWESPITLDSDPPGLASAALAADGSGTAHVAWAEKKTAGWDAFVQSRAMPTLIGDLDASCTVDIRDIMNVVAHWNSAVTDSAFNFDGDDQIGAGDAAQVASRWRVSCP